MTLRLLFHLPLRQAEGFLQSLFGMMGLELDAPDHTTPSRRGQHRDVRLDRVSPRKGLHLIVDSTGLSIVGAGEWARAIACNVLNQMTELGQPESYSNGR